jgi:hypothetical protein
MNAKGAKSPYNPYIHISSDEGKSWRHKYLDTINYLAGQWIAQPVPSPAVSSDGTLHAVYPSYVYSQNAYPQYIHVYSENGGFTFNYSTVYVEKTPFSDSLAKRVWLLICDKSDSQHLAFFNISNVYGDGDVFLWESSDKGITWSEPKRINDDTIANGRMQDLVWADFNENGDLFVTWRDRRNAPDTGFETSSEIWGAVKYKENADFEKNLRISDSLVPYDTILGATNGNDFQGVRFTDNTIYSAWGSNKNGYLNIWFAKSVLTPTSIESIIVKDINSGFIVTPNPASDYIEIGQLSKVFDPSEGSGIKIYNTFGECVKNLSPALSEGEGVRIDISHLPVGLYLLQIGNYSEKFMVVR